MDRLTRKELKTDKFAREVEHTVEYFGSHRQQVLRYGGIAAAVLLVAAGAYFYIQRQSGLRQEALKAAFRLQDAGVGPAPTPGTLSYATPADKDNAIAKAFNELVAKYPGSEEAAVSNYYLGVKAADQGRIADAEKLLRVVVSSGNANYASLANYALAQLQHGQGKLAESEKLLRDLISKPTVFVSKEQATITLARVISATKPDEARKLLEPLRTERSAVSRAAMNALGEMTASKK